MISDPMSEHIDTENFQTKLPLPEGAEGFEFNTEQHVTFFRFEGDIVIIFHDEEDQSGIPSEETEEIVKRVFWDIVDEDDIEQGVDQSDTLTIGRVNVHTSSDNDKMMLWGEISSSYVSDSTDL